MSVSRGGGTIRRPVRSLPGGPTRAKTALQPVETMTILAVLPPAFPLAAAGGEGLDYLEIARNSGPIGIAVLLLLLGASAVSWAIIVKKWLQIRRAQDESVKFLETFWQSKRLDAIYQAAESLGASPISQVFRAGYVELSKVTRAEEGDGDGGMHDELGGIENVERALKRAAASEVTHLEAQVPFLGTTASAAPFVGLFGTVWGIMRAFHDIYRMGNANLATVARPISRGAHRDRGRASSPPSRRSSPTTTSSRRSGSSTAR